jgi:hypothetical protein
MGRNRERTALKGIYRSRKWWAKVDGMTDDTALAIFLRLRRQNKV